MGVRYSQTKHAAEKLTEVMRSLARRAGLGTLSKRLSGRLETFASRWKAFRNVTSETLDRLSDVRLIGPVVRSYAAHYRKVEHRSSEKLSEEAQRFFRAMVDQVFSRASSAKEREKAASSSSEEIPGRTLRSIPQ